MCLQKRIDEFLRADAENVFKQRVRARASLCATVVRESCSSFGNGKSSVLVAASRPRQFFSIGAREQNKGARVRPLWFGTKNRRKHRLMLQPEARGGSAVVSRRQNHRSLEQQAGGDQRWPVRSQNLTAYIVPRTRQLRAYRHTH